MIEKVNPSHPDKIADRIAGALVDLAYKHQDNPKVAIEVLIGHGFCFVMCESSFQYHQHFDDIKAIVHRIAGDEIECHCISQSQDTHLARNQEGTVKCGDNGIFRGVPLADEDMRISRIAHDIYANYPSDGKYIIDKDKLVICQSNASAEDLAAAYPGATVNPLGDWSGGTDVDTGATNRKLGSDMARSVTGGGLHGKDLSKADVSANIYAFLKAQETGQTVELSCAIGDECIDGVPYEQIVDIARDYIKFIGGFEKLAEWGLF